METKTLIDWEVSKFEVFGVNNLGLRRKVSENIVGVKYFVLQIFLRSAIKFTNIGSESLNIMSHQGAC